MTWSCFRLFPLLACFALNASFDRAAAAPLSLPDYAQRFLQTSETLKNAKLELEKAEQALRISRDLFQTELTVEPRLSHQRQEFTPSDISLYERNFDITGALNQKSAWGTELSLQALETFENSNNVVGRIDRTLSLSLSQPLVRNAFGALSRLEIEKSELEAERLRLELRKTLIAECLRGSGLFVQTFSAQEKYRVLRELTDEAEGLRELSDRDYRNRLVRKLDWLSYQADFLDVENRLVEQQRELESFFAQLTILAERPSGKPELLDPEAQFPAGTGMKWNPQGNLDLLSQAKLLAREEKAVELFRREKLSEVALGVEVGRRQGQALIVGATLDDFEDNYLNFSLKWAWPLRNDTLDAKFKNAHKVAEQARLNREALQKDLESAWFEFLNRLQADEKRREVSRKKIGLFEQQIAEAQKLLRAGKYEVEDYLDFRKRFLNEKLAALDLSEAVWKAKLKIYELNGELPPYCARAEERGGL